jgi:hypothetical protein
MKGMIDKFELTKEYSDEIVKIAYTHFKKYNKIRMDLNGFIELYINYSGNQGFSDYALPYDNFEKIHWLEFMTHILIDEGIIGENDSDDYLRDIFVNNIHPIYAYKNYR